RAEFLLKNYGPPLLIEQFVGGREFHVNVIEDGRDRHVLVLPLSEIAYKSGKDDWWPIYTFAAKWDMESQEYKDCPVIAPVEIPPEPTARLSDICARAFRLLDCRDYARLDVRMSDDGSFQILEMNPNPYLNSLALVRGLEAIGLTHEQLVVELMLAAIERGGN